MGVRWKENTKNMTKRGEYKGRKLPFIYEEFMKK